MAEPIPPSAQSSSYSLTTLSSYVSTDRRAVTDMNGWYRRGRWLRTIFGRLRRRECCMLGAPSSQPTVPLHELPPSKLVIHRQTSAHERRKWTRSVQSRSGILAFKGVVVPSPKLGVQERSDLPPEQQPPRGARRKCRARPLSTANVPGA